MKTQSKVTKKLMKKSIRVLSASQWKTVALTRKQSIGGALFVGSLAQ